MSSRIRVGPARMPSRESPEAAIETILERGYAAVEIDFESGFWMDYPFAERLGVLAREHDVALSVHAPLFGFMGHLEASGRKFTSAVGALDRSAGIVAASGAELVVFHPGFFLGRSREDALDAVVEQLGMLRERLEAKGRAVPFGIEVMGRVRDLGSVDDIVEISRRLDWVRPVLDFAHMHATSDGAFLEPEPFREALELADEVIDAGRTVPHPLLRHRVRQPQRDEAPPVRRGDAPSGAATRRARVVRAPGDRDLRVAGRGVESGDPLGSRGLRGQQLRDPRLVDRLRRPRAPARGRRRRAAREDAARESRIRVARRASSAERYSSSASSSRPCAAADGSAGAVERRRRSWTSSGHGMPSSSSASRSASSTLPS